RVDKSQVGYHDCCVLDLLEKRGADARYPRHGLGVAADDLVNQLLPVQCLERPFEALLDEGTVESLIAIRLPGIENGALSHASILFFCVRKGASRCEGTKEPSAKNKGQRESIGEGAAPFLAAFSRESLAGPSTPHSNTNKRSPGMGYPGRDGVSAQ